MKFESYWNTIFSSSKRLMTCDGSVYGDNTDVRAPVEEELSRGGGWSGVSAGRGLDRPKPSKLTLDGVFFVNGGFAGPNELGSWEQTVFAAEAHLACAAMAREARGKGRPASEFFAQVQAFTGYTEEQQLVKHRLALYWKSGDPDTIRKYERQMVGRRVAAARKYSGDEAAFAQIESWLDAPVPKFHKL